MSAIEHPSFPDPMTPAICDLRRCETMPLDVRWLRDSSMVMQTTGEGFRAAMLLFTASWHQVPAGSLPNDDKELSVLSGCGRFFREFLKVKDQALQGWTLCSDGRWYHPEVARQVLDAWQEKQVSHDRRMRRSALAKTAANARWSRSTVSCKESVFAEGSDCPTNMENFFHEPGQSLHASALRTHCASIPVSNTSGLADGNEVASLQGVAPCEGVAPCQKVPEFDRASNLVKKKKTSRRTGVSDQKDLRNDLLAVSLPDWLPRDAWEQYVDFRFEIKCPLTPRARDMSIKKLSELREEGNDPVAVIENSIISGWKGLFPLRGGGRQPPAKGRIAANPERKPENSAKSAVTRL